MKKSIFIFLLFASMHLYAQQTVNIIPQPVSLQLNNGSFTLNDAAVIKYSLLNKDLKAAAELFAASVKALAGINLKHNAASSKTIELAIKKTEGVGDEGYLLNVSSSSVVLSANTKTGILYGIQTLLQAMQPKSASSMQIPAMTVKDFPRFQYRGMHLDVGRHFYPVSFVKKYIDFLATYKFNYFHWHLTEDQGWRIEIKKYPELTSVGGYRNGTIIGRYPGTANTNLHYGGFYTQEEVKEVVAYAAQRSITVIPEIELPGHSSAAIKAYPWLSCFPNKPTDMKKNPSAFSKLMQETNGEVKEVQETWGVFDDIFCAGKESTFEFLKNVFDEVLPLFPSKYIHVGGDEAPKEHWKVCPACQARIKAEGLKDEHELQNYFITRIEKYINSKGRTIIGWDEILEGGLAPNAIVMSWRGEKGGIEAAKQNHQVIMTPSNPVYFDHHQGDPSTEPIGIGGFNNLKKIYAYEPVPKELNAQEAKYVLGAQANMWTEYVPTTQHVEYMVLPRMLALSEVVWSPKEIRNWDSFNERLQPHFTNFEKKGWNYSRGNYKVDIKTNAQNGQLFATLATEIFKGQVVYTTDGSQPTTTSTKYNTPIPVSVGQTILASVIVEGKIESPLPTKFVVEEKK
ncbi:MAG TPA: family 20 glycosylhydrolase [Ferruginibacter sp.]|nr:family 20 glycosylhydrolase [Ferruginibacter sp.]HRE62750.1 family 20 glycosylhydrolase [Ferruginibacter sp.]